MSYDEYSKYCLIVVNTWLLLSYATKVNYYTLQHFVELFQVLNLLELLLYSFFLSPFLNLSIETFCVFNLIIVSFTIWEPDVFVILTCIFGKYFYTAFKKGHRFALRIILSSRICSFLLIIFHIFFWVQ